MVERALVFGMIAVVCGAACTVAEVIRPARSLSYSRVIVADGVSFVIYILLVFPAAQFLSDRCQDHVRIVSPTAGWPLPLRIIGYFLVADLGSYVLHRLMHARWLWRIHKWHHAPKYMYWFAGVRATVQQQFLFNLPAILAVPVLGSAPAWVYFGLAVELIIRNDWMHMNVTWRSNWLEWILVTPRYHHVHHSAEHQGNFGSLFTIWDRVFGTRIDPDAIIEPIVFGTGEDDNRIRLVVGI